MRKLILLAATLFVACATSGCIGLVAPVMPPQGWVVTSYKAPLDYDQEESLVGTKTGTSESICILGLVAVGDASTRTAARNGGLTKLHGADYEYLNILFVFQQYRTVVNGE